MAAELSYLDRIGIQADARMLAIAPRVLISMFLSKEFEFVDYKEHVRVQPTFACIKVGP